MPNSATSGRVPWWLVAALWATYAVVVIQDRLVSGALTGEQRSLRYIMVPVLTSALTWALMTPAILRFHRLVQDRVRSTRWRWASWAAGFLVVQTVDACVDYARSHLLLYGRATFTQTFWLQFTLNLSIYAMILLAAHMLQERHRRLQGERRAARLEGQLAQAELAALRTQLQPHFLFNTLNTIAELMHHEPDVADLMTIRLGHLLRVSLDHAKHAQVPLAEELRFLDMYLDIQRARLRDALRVRIDVAPGALDALVPTLCLQPLVENAIRHGMGPECTRIEILVRGRVEGGRLELCIEDGGLGIDAAARVHDPERSGIGVGNVRAALERLHGDAQALALEPREGGGTRVRISMPRVVAPAAEARAAS